MSSEVTISVIGKNQDGKSSFLNNILNEKLFVCNEKTIDILSKSGKKRFYKR
jgi:predicted GTPase